jgi:nanoRNase/pAp phosphatase (c-di-AMP/oligoRNAs hydrolase)
LKNLSFFSKKKVFIITHAGADIDAICAAFALFSYLKRKNQAKILVPDHISLPAKNFAQNLKIPYKVSRAEKLNKADCLVLVDFNDLKMAGSLSKKIKGFQGPLYLIDHHQPAKTRIAKPKNSLIDPNAVASCELVYALLKKSHAPIDKKTAACIASGLVTDSAFFLTAGPKTFSMVAETLKKSEKPFSYILSLFREKQTFDEKIAKLKAAKRSKIYLISNYIAVTSDVGAFEADSASALTRIGADIAFVGDANEGKLRISGRATSTVVRKEGFDLAKNVFQKLPKHFGGSGGGHKGAAGFSGEGTDIFPALEKCVSLTKDFFKKKKGYRFKEYT